MRADNHIGKCQKFGILRRLLFKNIQPQTVQLLFLQQLIQIILIQQTSPGCIDDDQIAFRMLQILLIQNMACFLCQRKV